MKVEKHVNEAIRLKRHMPDTLEEDNSGGMRKFEMVFSVDGTKSQQTVSAINIQKAEELIRKQYDGKSVVFTSKKEIYEKLKEDFSSPAPGTDTGLANLIIDAINDEWEAISAYNDLIEVMSREGHEDMVKVINDIANEENTHVGQLQEILKTISSNVGNIDNGASEAASQLDNTVDDDFGSASGFEAYF